MRRAASRRPAAPAVIPAFCFRRRSPRIVLSVLAVLAAAALPLEAAQDARAEPNDAAADAFVVPVPEDHVSAGSPPGPVAALGVLAERLERDREAMERFRPGYPFWRHIFAFGDGSILFGSGMDGRLLAVFPAHGDWGTEGRWEDGSLGSLLDDRRLPSRLTLRRDEVAGLLEARVGPIVHNATRGEFVRPNVERYGSFLGEWATIYERFGVPAGIGLAQALVESGFKGQIRSQAGALGLCQWLPANWNRLRQLSPHELEGYNQTTQAPYCAAYLTVLAVRYGSFIPALSEHHAGGTNVGRTLIHGERLGGEGTRERYLIGSEFARDMRSISLSRYREMVRSYGPRSFLYSEMVFGNLETIRELIESVPQEPVFAMRAPRAISLAEVRRETGLTTDEVRRFNPSLLNRVPRGANLYLPVYLPAFGEDVAFWHRPADFAFVEVLDAFVQLESQGAVHEEAVFVEALRGFRERFEATNSEEGQIMATVLAFVIEDATTSRRSQILAEFEASERIRSLFERGVAERESVRSASERVDR